MAHGLRTRPLEILNGSTPKARLSLERSRTESEKEEVLKTLVMARSTRETTKRERKKDGESLLRRTAQSSKESSSSTSDQESLSQLTRLELRLTRPS